MAAAEEPKEYVDWKGQRLSKGPDIIKAALQITEESERQLLLTEVRKCGPHAISNFGYFAGYYDKDEAKKILTFFETTHPVFGPSWPDVPVSPDDAFKMGQEWAKKKKSK